MIPFDPDLDGPGPEVFQPLVIEAFDDVVVLRQWRSTGDFWHVICIPTESMSAFQSALSMALRDVEGPVVFDFNRGVTYPET